jgi:hypothetical protein
MLRKSLFFSLLVVPLLVASVAQASHSWSTYHWARSVNPFTLKLGDNVSASWDTYLATASSDWSVSTVLDTSIVMGSASNPRTCKAVNGTVQVCNASYGNNGWLGLASIWADANGHITKGTAKMNDTYFNSATYNTPAWKRLVMCQEVAHAFGLDHQDEAFGAPNLGTCMDYTNDPDGGGAYGPSNEHPNQHDYDQLVSIYGSHLDGYTTLAAVLSQVVGKAKAALVSESEDNAELGRAVGWDANGRANKFEREIGNGKIITHVFWLPE